MFVRLHSFGQPQQTPLCPLLTSKLPTAPIPYRRMSFGTSCHWSRNAYLNFFRHSSDRRSLRAFCSWVRWPARWKSLEVDLKLFGPRGALLALSFFRGFLRLRFCWRLLGDLLGLLDFAKGTYISQGKKSGVSSASPISSHRASGIPAPSSRTQDRWVGC